MMTDGLFLEKSPRIRSHWPDPLAPLTHFPPAPIISTSHGCAEYTWCVSP